MKETVIVGCGFVGGAAARLLAPRTSVIAVRRSDTPIQGARLIRADVSNLGSLRSAIGRRPWMIYAVSPGGRTDEAYESAYESGLQNALAAIQPERFVLVSSTGVMADAGGDWVDENTPLQLTTFTQKRLQKGEAIARARGGAVLRLGGIYGPGRDRMIRSVRDGTARSPAGAVFTNRIHRDDAARAAIHLLEHDAKDVFLGVDSDPARLSEVHQWLADRLGVPAPPAGESARSRSNKRCRNARLLRSGFRFDYPSFRDGYAEMIRLMDAPDSPGHEEPSA